MEQEFSNVPPAPKKNNTVLIVVAVVFALLCCCCILIVGGFALLGPTVGNTFESIEESLPYEMPSEEELPSVEDVPFIEEDGEGFVPDMSAYVPTGGLGDEILRTDTWLNITFSAAMANCVIPADGAENTGIEVTQNPDGAGVWVERWTVPCEDGSSKAFDITFTPADGGGTDISIQSAE